MKRSTKRIVALFLAMTLVAAACSRSDDGDGGGGATSGTDGTAAPVTDGTGTEVAAVATTDKCEGYDATRGISDGTLLLGGSMPLGLPFKEIAAGAQAYFAMRNAENPIADLQIEWKLEDDKYQAIETKKNWDKLTQEDGVFATFLVVGTQNNKTFLVDNNDECIPNLFAATGSEAWGNPTDFPWTIGSIPAYPLEAAVFVEYLKNNQPDAKLAVLYQNDDFGKSYLNALKAAVEGTDIEIVGEESYPSDNPNTKSQITTLKGTGADAIFLGTTIAACSGSLNEIALLDWDPTRYLSATCTSPALMGSARTQGSSEGTLSALYLKAPDDPRWDDDADMIEFKAKSVEYGLTSEQADDGLTVFGWIMADLFAQGVDAADVVDRAGVMNSFWSLDEVTSGLLLPGIVVSTDGANDPFAIEAMSIATDNGEIFEMADDAELIDFSGQTGDFLP